MEPAQVPGVFQQAFHLMRSGRPGPVLIDLPFDVQMAEIDFDADTYTPLPVYKPTASRAQIDRALDMLVTAERPLIVVARDHQRGTPPTLVGWQRRCRFGRPHADGGAPSRRPPVMAGMVGLQTSQRTATPPCWSPTS